MAFGHLSIASGASATKGTEMAKPKQIASMIALGIIALLTASASASAKQKRVQASDDVKAIKATLDRQVEAWNRHDLEGFMAGYWNSDNLTFYSGGSNVSGWKTTLSRYRNRYQSAGAEMGKLQFTDLQIELLGPAAAFVRGHWALTMSASQPGGLFTLVFRKVGGQWKIVHDHTSTQ
jgi:ketosteroid isomerase-like protein